jgi:diguanylate cyclase (GGDEF)-like protein
MPTMGRKEKILVVDDEEIVRVQIGRVLAKEGYDVTAASSGEEAIAIMAKTSFDLVLSDMVMEGMDGLAFLKEVNRKYPKTIFMIITGHGSLATAIQSMRLGAFDYLLKPCDNTELIERIQRGLREWRLLKKAENQARKLEQMAITDGLTGLYSRSYFMETLNREFKHHLRYKSPLSFMMIDIDHFKRVNDRFGHRVGDEVLKSMADKFRKIIRETDVIGRYGGEEFGVIQPRTDHDGARRTTQRILSAISIDSTLCAPPGERPQPMTVSIGIASCPHPDIQDPSQLIEAADKALYHAKHAGRNRGYSYGSSRSIMPSEDFADQET